MKERPNFIEKIDIPSIRPPIKKSRVTFYDKQGNVLSRKVFNHEQPTNATIEYVLDIHKEAKQ